VAVLDEGRVVAELAVVVVLLALDLVLDLLCPALH
jgi:hypothetical protein